MFLREAWYVAAWSTDVETKPVGRVLLNDAIVFFRDAKGQIAAIENRCVHRHLPLSMGWVKDGTIQCGYHGLRFDRRGQCVEIPGQSLIPGRARVRSYPVIERYGWVWIWMGDADAADPSFIPDCAWVSSPAYSAIGGTKLVRASYRLLIENLLDSSHISYVHQSTVGGVGSSNTPTLKVRKTGTGVILDRWIEDVPPPPTYLRTGRITGNVDRWQESEFVLPALVRQRVGGADTGTVSYGTVPESGVQLFLTHFLTPSTEDTCLYFWSSGRDFSQGDENVSKALFDDTSLAFEEDRVVLEAQQIAEERFSHIKQININADAAAFQARQLLEKALSHETTREAAASLAAARDLQTKASSSLNDPDICDERECSARETI